jgi:16S rRNA processing protein RimM
MVPLVDIEAGTVTLTPPIGLFEDVPDETPAPVADTATNSDAATATAADTAADTVADPDTAPTA